MHSCRGASASDTWATAPSGGSTASDDGSSGRGVTSARGGAGGHSAVCGASGRLISMRCVGTRGDAGGDGCAAGGDSASLSEMLNSTADTSIAAVESDAGSRNAHTARAAASTACTATEAAIDCAACFMWLTA